MKVEYQLLTSILFLAWFTFFQTPFISLSSFSQEYNLIWLELRIKNCLKYLDGVVLQFKGEVCWLQCGFCPWNTVPSAASLNNNIHRCNIRSGHYLCSIRFFYMVHNVQVHHSSNHRVGNGDGGDDIWRVPINGAGNILILSGLLNHLSAAQQHLWRPAVFVGLLQRNIGQLKRSQSVTEHNRSTVKCQGC